MAAFDVRRQGALSAGSLVGSAYSEALCMRLTDVTRQYYPATYQASEQLSGKDKASLIAPRRQLHRP